MCGCDKGCTKKCECRCHRMLRLLSESESGAMGWRDRLDAAMDLVAQAWDEGWRAGRGRGPGHTDACPTGGGRSANPYRAALVEDGASC